MVSCRGVGADGFRDAVESVPAKTCGKLPFNARDQRWAAERERRVQLGEGRD